MPFEVLDQRGASTTSSLFSPEIQASYLKSKAMLDYHGSNGMARTPTTKMASASPLGKVLTMGAHSLDYSDLPQSFLDTDAQKGKPPHARKEESANLGRTLWTPLKQNQVNSPGFDSRLTSLTARINLNDTIESSLFSSSLSEMFSNKMRLSANKLPNHFGITVASDRQEKERLELLKEIEVKCIGNLLPDGDDLFYGVGEELESAINVTGNADMGDFDLFGSGGGMELEGDDAFCASYGDSHFISGTSGGHVDRYPFVEHPSRTLFVRNVDSNVEESELRVLFERYGDIQVLYTACKHRGFVLTSYYDIRASQNAMNALHNRPLRQMKLDIRYSLPKDNPLRKEINHGILTVLNLDPALSGDDLCQFFGVYGEIKKIHETSHSQHHKFVEFYDIRAAEAALRALNGTNVAGKQIVLKLSSPEGLIHCTHASEQDKPNLCQSLHAVATRPWGNTTMVSHGIDTSMCVEKSHIQGPHTQNHGFPLMDMGFSQEIFSVPSTLSSAAAVVSSGSKYGEARLATNHINIGHQIQHLQHQSLPEYQYSLGSNTTYNIGNTMSSITGNHLTGEMGRIPDVGAYEHSIELMSHGNRSSPLHVNGRHLGSLSYQHLSSSPIPWQNSPPFLNGTRTNGPLPVTGFPGSAFHMLPNMQRHHVGSAPAVNPTLWDKQHASLGSPNASGFPLGSLGSAGFLPVSTMNLPEVSSQNTLSQARRSSSEFSKKSAPYSPQQTSHMLHGRNSKIPASTSFHPSGERMRFRRNEAVFSQADKKEYGLDIERILRDGDSRTTLMIKNIPNKYTSKMLLAAIDENHRGTYDFVYLPIDFKNKCNVGYAFINMIDPLHIVPFYKTFEGKKWEKFNSEKVASLAYARIQGKTALICHFQNSSLMNEDKRCRPILFHTEGPNAGDQEPFPVGSNVRSRPGKPRTFNMDESRRQKSPSNCNNAEESNKRTDQSSTSSSDQE